MPIPQPQDWSQAYASVQRLADRAILAEIRRALRDINRMLGQIDPSLGRVGDLVRINQLNTVKRNLLLRQSQIFNNMGDIIAERRALAALQATVLGTAIDDVLFSAIGQGSVVQQLRNSLTAGLNQTIDVAISRMTVSAVPLAERIYQSSLWANGVLQKRINSALLRGLSAREFAKEARSWFDPSVPGGTRYAAMRLARTEINNAFHATSVMQAQEKPWITSVKWHLSRSHPKPDNCDALAKGGPKGDGVYPKMEVPRKPHPQCFCFVTPVSLDEDEFLDGLVAGKYDQYLRQKLGQAQARPNVKTVKPTKRAAAPAPRPIKPPPTPAPTRAVPPAETLEVPRFAKQYHRNLSGLDDLARRAESQSLDRIPLTGGVSADTELLTYADGKKLVRKSAGNPGAEQASSIIGRAIGTRAPRVYRNHPSQVYMDYLDEAKTAAEVIARKLYDVTDLYGSDEGLRIGLFDLLIANADRNSGNWMIGPNRTLFPIDHGHAGPIILEGRPFVRLKSRSPFAEQVFLEGGFDHKFSRADIEWARDRIGEVGPDLIHAGYKDFLDYALGVLDRMLPLAKGIRNIISP